MDWKPRTDEPSNARPSSNTLSSNAEAGIEKCWTTPGRSQNRMSTYSTFSSLISLKMSSEVVSATECSPSLGNPLVTLWTRCCTAVKHMLRGRYACRHGRCGRCLPSRHYPGDMARTSGSGLGSWLSGPGTPEPGTYPGERLGLPKDGPGSIARFGRRIAALIVDWLTCYGLSALAMTVGLVSLQNLSTVVLGV